MLVLVKFTQINISLATNEVCLWYVKINLVALPTMCLKSRN